MPKLPYGAMGCARTTPHYTAQHWVYAREGLPIGAHSRDVYGTCTRGMHGGGGGQGHGRRRVAGAANATKGLSAALTHGAEPTLATGMEVAPEAAARREPLSTYLPLRRCAVMPHARTRSSSCAGKEVSACVARRRGHRASRWVSEYEGDPSRATPRTLHSPAML
jgi:hypothetical protein